ncbi:hypothetical protein XENOCAPTIV_026647 [Xenoophorus captivus]|uniref:Uncharacterized protein n=1 Tax=Xenoophorus captivus TaxID=1517983 RepID=A0ABV0RM02_9TELE
MDETHNQQPEAEVHDSLHAEADAKISSPPLDSLEAVTDRGGDSWVTRGNPVGEITSSLSSLCVSDNEESEEEEDIIPYFPIADLPKLKDDLTTVVVKVNALENIWDSVSSPLNREQNLRTNIERNIETIQEHMITTLKEFEGKLVQCLQSCDEK